MDRKLRIAVDCRITDAQQGIGTALLALAKALSDSKVADQEYTFIVREDKLEWLAPYIYGPCKLAGIPRSTAMTPTTTVSIFSKVKSAVRWIAPLRFIWRKWGGGREVTPVSDGYVESHQFDIVHFPTQMAYLTKLPSIYQPWDLQHLHYPSFFSKDEIIQRERDYRAFCDAASYVCIQAEWTKRDVVRHYGLPEDKVVVIPWGVVFDAYRAPSVEVTCATVEKYTLPKQFFFYPAVTWPHKNHEVILRALHVLKTEHDAVPHVYFSGRSTGYRPALNKLAEDLGVIEQIHFLGFLEPDELQAVFGVATAMIFPSKFEGFGLPILEAFHAGLPVISSNATTLPEVAGDGALYFNPDSPYELASLMKKMMDTPETRENLIRGGKAILSKYAIGELAANFQALYEKTAVLSFRDGRVSPVSAAV